MGTESFTIHLYENGEAWVHRMANFLKPAKNNQIFETYEETCITVDEKCETRKTAGCGGSQPVWRFSARKKGHLDSLFAAVRAGKVDALI